MSRRRVVWVVVILVLLGAAAAAILLDPAARVQGWVNREPFFAGKSATAWNRELRNSDEAKAAEARKALIEGKGDAVPVCAWVLRHAPEAQARIRAADALREMKKDAAPAAGDLVAALADPDADVRGTVCRAIAGLAPDVPGAVPALVKLFPDIDAIRAVAAFKGGAAEALPELMPLLKSSDPVVRRQAVRAVGKIGPAAKSAVPQIIALVQTDPEAGVQEQAAEALGDIGPEAKEGIPALVGALKHPTAMVRRDAVRSLGQMGAAAKDVLPAVRAMTADPDEKVKDAAARSVRQIDPTAPAEKKAGERPKKKAKDAGEDE